MEALSRPVDRMLGHYSAVVVGSGYGGAITAARIARGTRRVCPGARQGALSRPVPGFRALGIARDPGPYAHRAPRVRGGDVRLPHRPRHHGPGGLRGRHRLYDADAEDVGQSVWLKLVEQLDRVREPAALPGWLATTARRECLRVLGSLRGTCAVADAPDFENIADDRARTAEQELLAVERLVAVREAFMALHPDAQTLIALLMEDPPLPYAEISARLGIPVGSIGPMRARCLDKLRRHLTIAALINPGRRTAYKSHGQAVA